MSKSLHLMVLRTQQQYGWTFSFANAYAVARFVEGMSHQRALTEAMRNPLVRNSDKPRSR
jgi:hypothetical protein